MHKNSRLPVAATVLAITLRATFAMAQAAPDIILSNGNVFTSAPGNSHVEALAIRGERRGLQGPEE